MIEALRTDEHRNSRPRSSHEINRSVRGINRGREVNAPANAQGNLTRLDIIIRGEAAPERSRVERRRSSPGKESA